MEEQVPVEQRAAELMDKLVSGEDPLPEEVIEEFMRLLDLVVVRPEPELYSVIDVPSVVATLALVPFVQAVASSLGEVFSQKIDQHASQALSTFKRILIRTAPRPTEPLESRITLSEDVPTHALSQLVTIDYEALPSGVPLTVRWMSVVWCASYLENGQIADLYWNAHERCWVSQPDQALGSGAG
ncbi:hypothetical protein [Streptomyces sp. sk2.1]|uniref:hypothetical protein n=1 Tax=Streptomyces sp. sk2.1 TaxID=2478959 RepID=UPI0011E6B586|nr:hypothetical protein [Streptomyces sp. sk2.1]TXS58521.1 hypothetical protein EAO76_43110 [Streptomyces sp. sk2.1]